MAEADASEKILTATLGTSAHHYVSGVLTRGMTVSVPDKIESVRRMIPVHQQRRSDVYEIIRK